MTTTDPDAFIEVRIPTAALQGNPATARHRIEDAVEPALTKAGGDITGGGTGVLFADFSVSPLPGHDIDRVYDALVVALAAVAPKGTVVTHFDGRGRARQAMTFTAEIH